MQGQVSFYNHHTNVGQDGKTDVCRKKRSITHKVEQEQHSLLNPWSRQVAEVKKTEVKPSTLGARVYNGCSSAVGTDWITEHPDHQPLILASLHILGCHMFSFPDPLQKLSATVAPSFHWLKLTLKHVVSSTVISKCFPWIIWQKNPVSTESK